MKAPSSTSKPVLIVLSILTGMNVVNGGLSALEIVSVQVAGLIALGTAAVSAAIGFYLQGQVVPLGAVDVRITGDGKRVASEASKIPTGTEVDVRPVGPSPYSPSEPFG